MRRCCCNAPSEVKDAPPQQKASHFDLSLVQTIIFASVSNHLGIQAALVQCFFIPGVVTVKQAITAVQHTQSLTCNASCSKITLLVTMLTWCNVDCLAGEGTCASNHSAWPEMDFQAVT
jgi:hypothetical protein